MMWTPQQRVPATRGRAVSSPHPTAFIASSAVNRETIAAINAGRLNTHHGRAAKRAAFLSASGSRRSLLAQYIQNTSEARAEKKNRIGRIGSA